MSLQTCLPVGKKRRNHRPKQDNDNHDNSDDENVFMTIEDLQHIDAMDYMASVRDEADDLPNVFVCPSHPLKEDTQQHNTDVIDGSVAACMYLTSERSSLIGPPYPISKRWVDLTCHSFSLLRQYISTCHQAGIGLPPNRIPVPPSKHDVFWHIFCLGQDEANGNVNGYYDDSDNSNNNDDDNDNDDDDDDSKGTLDNVQCNLAKRDSSEKSEWDKKTVPSDGHSPTVALLCQLDQVLSRRVLSHLIQYLIDGWEMTTNRGRWIYALLARLEKPLHREECSLLYSFLKHLCQLRSTKQYHQSLEKNIPIINTLIVIIAVYFEQAQSDQVFNYVNQ